MASERQWSLSQAAAIRERSGPLLVSAGAGSGKTSVLVERVISRIIATDGVDVDRLLIVTFTEAAATEMRERIAAALRRAAEGAADPAEEERALRQLHLLDLAPISTLHSFCLQAVRAAAGQAGADPGFRVATQDEADLLAETVLDNLLEDWLADDQPSMRDFVVRFGGDLGEEALRDIVLQLHQFARSQPLPSVWLARALERFAADAAGRLADASFASELFSGMSLRLDEALTHLREAHRVCLGAGCDGAARVIADEASVCGQAVSAAEGSDHAVMADALVRIFAPRLTLPRDADAHVRDRVTALRNRAKDLVKPLSEGVGGRSEERLLEELRDLASHMETLVALTMAFGAAYQDAKARLGVVDFSDLEHMARRALADDGGTPTELARHFRDHFVEVMVDEYQDTSPIQDDIISLVTQPENRNLFLVGDVKQSIYRFRMAEPMLFLRRSELYKDSTVGVRIDLAENYRSRRRVVEAVNFFFEQVFCAEFGGAAYDERSRMRQGARYPDVSLGEQTLDGPAELHIVERAPDRLDSTEQDHAGDDVFLADGGGNPDSDGHPDQAEDDMEELAATEREALVAGTRLKQLHAARALVYRADEGKYEPVEWRDMVVLLRAKAGRSEDFLRVFRQLGIPVVGDSDGGYYAGYEMRLAVSLLQIIDNADQDIALAAVLRSPVGGFDSTELARVRLTRKGSLFTALRSLSRDENAPDGALRDKAADFLRELASWRATARLHSVPEAVELLLRKADLVRFCSVLPGGDVRVANLRQLVSSARNFSLVQTGNFRDFVRYLERHRLQAADPGAAPTLGEQEDAVRIMTIHRSKGLEFPVTVVAGLGQRFQVNRKGRVALHRTLGFGPSYIDLDRREVYASAASAALDGALLRDSLAEEARILYVAMTRAREKLILVGAVRNVGRQVDKWRAQPSARDQGRPQLPLSVLMAGRSGLDWIGPCVFRSGEEANAVIEVRLWDTPDGQPLSVRAAAESRGLDRTGIARLDPDALTVGGLSGHSTPSGRDEDEQVLVLRETLLRHVCEPLVSDGPSGVPMKLAVSDWRRVLREQEETDGVLEFGSATAQRHFARPRFVQAQEQPSAAERGTLVHAAMQRVDLSLDLTDEGVVRRELERLARQLGWSPAQLAAVPAVWLTRFFSGDVGRMMLAEARRVARELSFTFAVPAGTVAALKGVTAKEWIEHDQVIVQGTADCVILAPDGFTLIDYKTDRIADGAPYEHVTAAADAYQAQVALYATALSRALATPAKAAWLYFLAAGQAVQATTLTLRM